MLQTLWVPFGGASLLTWCLLRSSALRRGHPLLTIWVAGEMLGYLALLCFGGDTRQMPYAVVWSAAEAPLQALRMLAAGEVMVSLAKQYGERNRTFLRGFTGILATLSVALSLGSVAWLECRYFHPGDYPLVQAIVVGSRVVALAIALVLFASIVLMRRFPLPTLNRNSATLRNALAVYFLLVAVERYIVLYLVPIHYDTLALIGMLALARDAALWLWLVFSLRPAREVDFVPPLLDREYVRLRRKALVALTRARRDALRRAWRRLVGSRMRFA